MSSLRDLGSADLSSTRPKADGTVVERVAGVFQRRDQEFLNAFTVRWVNAVAIGGYRLYLHCIFVGLMP